MRVSWRLRAAVLILAGSVLLHQARFALSPADVGDRHGYLTWLSPVVAGLVLLLGLEFAVRVARLVSGRATLAEPPRRRMLWPQVSVVLLGVFGVQEAAEFVALHGHGNHDGLSHLLGAGAWLAVPLSLLIGGFIALTIRGADAAVAWAVAARQRPWPQRGVVLAWLVAAEPSRPALNVLAFFLAGRAPPVLSA